MEEKVSEKPMYAPGNYRALGQWVGCCELCMVMGGKAQIVKYGNDKVRHTGGNGPCIRMVYDKKGKLEYEYKVKDYMCGSGKPPNEILKGNLLDNCKACGSKNVLCIYYEYYADLVDAVMSYELECLECKKYTAYEYGR